MTNQNRYRALAGKGHLRSKRYPQLDEYPFASTWQGGRGAWVKAVSVGEHKKQALDLNRFYREELKRAVRSFLVVPLPF